MVSNRKTRTKFSLTISMARVDLPEEIVREILSRLPVKSLLRFRSVCKSWCSLLRNPDFIAQHHNYGILNSPYTSLVLQQGNYWNFFLMTDVSGRHLSVPNPFVFEYPVIKGSVNGLICLYDVDKDLVVLWNPATREVKPIPFSSFKPLPGSVKASTCCIGFGFDKKTNDYKILRFVRNKYKKMDHREQVQLYSLKNDSWKEISFDDDVVIVAGGKDEVWLNPYMDGVFFRWGRVRDGNEVFVLSFDFENEVFEKLLIPDCISFRFDGSQLAILDGMLSIFGYNTVDEDETEDDEPTYDDDYYKEPLVSRVNIWAMTQHGVKESWQEVKAPIHFTRYLVPVAFCKNYLLLKNIMDFKIVLCDLNTAKMNYSDELIDDMQFAYYVESLVPLNGR